MWILKVLAFLWPFIKEMVLGDKSLKEAIRDNKKKVAFAIFVLCSVGMNFFLISRLVVISQKYLEFQKAHPAIVAKVNGEKPPVPVPKALKPKPPAAEPEVEVPTEPEAEPPTYRPAGKVVVPKLTKKKKVRPPATNEDRYSRMKDDFDKIKAREDKDAL